jgi:hypothetical protein
VLHNLKGLLQNSQVDDAKTEFMCTTKDLPYTIPFVSFWPDLFNELTLLADFFDQNHFLLPKCHAHTAISPFGISLAIESL